jgi:hypothetical protein
LFDFTKAELKMGSKRCIDNVKGLLESSMLLTEANKGQYGLGLYMYAVEEFGKAILLRSYISGNKSKYQIPGWILGLGKGRPRPKDICNDNVLRELLGDQLIGNLISSGRRINSHDIKLLIGFNKLPRVCRILRGVKISTAFHANKTISIKSNQKISVPANITGDFFDMTTPIISPDLDLKNACFYMGWDYLNKNWSYDIATDPELEEKIGYFCEQLTLR